MLHNIMDYAQRQIITLLCEARASQMHPISQHDLATRAGLAEAVFNAAIDKLVEDRYVDRIIDSSSPIWLTTYRGVQECENQ